MTTPENVLYASTARPWLKYYAQKYIDQTLPTCSAFDYVCQQNKNRLGEAALPSLALVAVGLVPVILLSRTLRSRG